MTFTLEEIHYEGMRRFHWTRVQVKSDEGSEAVVLVGASRNFLNDHFRIPHDGHLEDAHIQRWLEEALSEMRTEFTEIENGGVYYKVYAHTAEGQVNGIKFFKEEVTP